MNYAPGLLKVNEVFGPTIQGEGPSAGKRAAFVRLAICNLHCSYCDTRYTWDFQEYDRTREIQYRSVEDVAKQVAGMDCPLVVISGGEPMLQRKPLARLIMDLILNWHISVEIETNGTQMLFEEADWVSYNVSPKLSFAGDPLDKRIRPDVLCQLATRSDVRWKFVVGHPIDVREIELLIQAYRINPDRIWIMPEGQTIAEINEHLSIAVKIADHLGCNVTDRLHIRLWGGKRGH